MMFELVEEFGGRIVLTVYRRDDDIDYEYDDIDTAMRSAAAMAHRRYLDWAPAGGHALYYAYA